MVEPPLARKDCGVWVFPSLDGCTCSCGLMEDYSLSNYNLIIAYFNKIPQKILWIYIKNILINWINLQVKENFPYDEYHTILQLGSCID